MIQTIKLTKLKTDPFNARVQEVEPDPGLIASIKAHGLIQPLAVRADADKPGHYFVFAGQRRLAALKHLHGRKAIDVPCLVHDVTDLEARTRSLSENINRRDMTPYDEITTWGALAFSHGKSAEDIAAEFGVPKKRVEQRLALARVTDDALDMLKEGKAKVSVLQALTLTDDRDLQAEVLAEALASAHPSNVSDYIRRRLTPVGIRAADVIFPLDRYHGPITSDLFADDADAVLQDTEQVRLLQREAAVEKLAEIADTVAFTDFMEAEFSHEWAVRFDRVAFPHTEWIDGRQVRKWDPDEMKRTGCVAVMNARHQVSFEYGLKPRDHGGAAVADDGDTIPEPDTPAPSADDGPKPWPAALCATLEEVSRHQVAARLAEDRHMALIVTILQMMGLPTLGWHGMAPSMPSGEAADMAEPWIEQREAAMTETMAEANLPFDARPYVLGKTRFVSWSDGDTVKGMVYALMDCTEEQLVGILTNLAAGLYAQRSGATHFLLARELGLDGDTLRAKWEPPAEFFERLTKPQIAAVAEEIGATKLAIEGGKMKRAALALALADIIEGNREAQKAYMPDDREKARTWVPPQWDFFKEVTP